MATKKEKKDYSQKATVNVVESTKTSQHELFTLVEHNSEVLVALGNQIVSKEKFETKEAAINYIDSKPWELILNATAVMMSKLNEYYVKVE